MRHTLSAALLAATALPAPAGASVPASADQAVIAALRQELGPPIPELEEGLPTRVVIAWVDLNGDGAPEALAHVRGRAWCGTGGCNLRILERRPEGFRIRGNLTVTHAPIGVLPTASRGWRDLSVRIAAHQVAVPFDGARYAPNPTVSPARELPPDAETEVLIATTDTGVPLYALSGR